MLFRYLFRFLYLVLVTILGVEVYGEGAVCSAVREPPQASIVADMKSGEILYAHNPDVRTQPASMAKIMTLRLVFKALRAKKITLHTLIKISERATAQKPCKLGLKKGEKITVKSAILALITKSANDIAVALAEHIAGSEKRFVSMMNKEARRLRMHSTLFCNASGWKNTSQLTTVRDMLRLSRSVISEYPEYFSLFSAKGFYYKGKYHHNHNKLLGENGGIIVDGLKTGFVCASGYNIAVTAKKGKERVVAVVVGGKTARDRDILIRWLLSNAFYKLAKKRYLRKNRRDPCGNKILRLKLNNNVKNHTPINKLIEEYEAENRYSVSATGKNQLERSSLFKNDNSYNTINKISAKETKIEREKSEINEKKDVRIENKRNNEKRETYTIKQWS